MKIDAKTFRLLTADVKSRLVAWMQENGLPAAANVTEVDVGPEETTVVMIVREDDGNIAVERDRDGRPWPKQKRFVCKTSTLPGSVRRALA